MTGTQTNPGIKNKTNRSVILNSYDAWRGFTGYEWIAIG